MARKGKVFEVSVSKQPCEACAQIGPNGFIGDRTGTSGIVIQSVETVRGINDRFAAQLPEPIQAGVLGDNILTEGLGNLTDLKAGDIVRIGERVLLTVVSKAAHYRKTYPKLPEEILQFLMEFGGIVCVVKEGAGEYVWDKDEIEILQTEELKGAA